MKPLATFLLCVVASAGVLAQPASGVGYDSPKQAFEALRAAPGVRGGPRGGWLVIAVDEGVNKGVWSFTMPNHPAHPAVARRIPIERNGQLYVDLRVLCGAEKSVCDEFYAEFKKLDEEVAREIQDKRQR